MPRGRMILKTLGVTSQKFAAVSASGDELCEFAQALYCLILANTDDFGRVAGSAFDVKHQVWPTHFRSQDDFDKAIMILVRANLLEAFEYRPGRWALEVVDFGQGQDLRKRTKSRFPRPGDDSGDFPEVPGSFPEVPGNSNPREGKGREGKGSSKGDSKRDSGTRARGGESLKKVPLPLSLRQQCEEVTGESEARHVALWMTHMAKIGAAGIERALGSTRAKMAGRGGCKDPATYFNAVCVRIAEEGRGNAQSAK